MKKIRKLVSFFLQAKEFLLTKANMWQAQNR